MLSLFLAVGAAIAGLAAAKTAGTAVASAIPVGLYKKNREHRRNMRLGINTELNEHKAQEAKKAIEAGLPPVIRPDADFGKFQFEKGDLPSSMEWIESQTWVLTESEFDRLFAMVCRDMMNENSGSYAEHLRALSGKYGVSYEELAGAARALTTKNDYDDLLWLSKNRMADPVIRQKLLKSG